MKVKSHNHKVKIRYDRVFKCLLFLGLLIGIGFYFFRLPLTNIYVTGNTFLKDQEIIELAKISNYPKMRNINKKNIEKALLNNSLISKVKVTKSLSTININIEETKPIYYDVNEEVTVLANGKAINIKYSVPILVNYVPDTIIELFRESLVKINDSVLNKISEIKYDPNIDKERFLLTMNDGNYVYINLKRFNLVNNYLTIISNFKDKKGIIYLDSGSHFEIFKES